MLNLDVHKIESLGLKVNLGLLHIDNEGTRNSLRVQDVPEWLRALARAERECDVLLVTAQGSVFCSGGNLRDQVKQGRARSLVGNLKIAKLLQKLEALKIPTAALVEGDVYGGGLEMLSAFDHVLTLPHCLFGFWQRRMGLSFGWGGGARMARRISSVRLKTLALEARALTASEAQAEGLIDSVVPRHLAMPEATAWCLRVGSLPRGSVNAIKRVSGADFKAGEKREFEKLWFGKEHRAALQRFTGV